MPPAPKRQLLVAINRGGALPFRAEGADQLGRSRDKGRERAKVGGQRAERGQIEKAHSQGSRRVGRPGRLSACGFAERPNCLFRVEGRGEGSFATRIAHARAKAEFSERRKGRRVSPPLGGGGQ